MFALHVIYGSKIAKLAPISEIQISLDAFAFGSGYGYGYGFEPHKIKTLAS